MTEKIRAHCNSCGGERNHDVLHSEETEWNDDDGYPTWGSDEYQTLRCRGCEEIKLRHTSVFSEHDEPTVYYFPPSIFRKLPKWLENMYLMGSAEESSVAGLLIEIYIAVQNNLPSLAIMGIRSLLEQIMIGKVGDKGTFFNNLNAFSSEGFISVRQKENLTTILEAGHAVTHRNYRPQEGDVLTVLDITEHIIESLYLHPPKVSVLKNRVPPRKPRND